jgi:hypothetical protein
MLAAVVVKAEVAVQALLVEQGLGHGRQQANQVTAALEFLLPLTEQQLIALVVVGLLAIIVEPCPV